MKFGYSTWKVLSRLLIAAAPLMVALKYIWPLAVSHLHERPMVDGPGVLSRGVCCVEPAYHFFGRVAWPAAVLFVIASILANAVADRLSHAIEPTDSQA